MEFIKVYMAAGYVVAIIHFMFASMVVPKVKTSFGDFGMIIFMWWFYLYKLAFGEER